MYTVCVGKCMYPYMYMYIRRSSKLLVTTVLDMFVCVVVVGKVESFLTGHYGVKTPCL